RGEFILYEIGRIDQVDAFLCKFAGDSAYERIGVASGQIPEHLHHTHVGHRSRKDLDVLHLARHYRLRDAAFFEKRDHLPQLADTDPFRIAGEFDKARIRFLFYRNYGKVDALGLRSFEYEKRELAVAGNEAKFHKVIS